MSENHPIAHTDKPIVKPKNNETMEKIICIGEKTWTHLLDQLKELSALASQVRRRFEPQTSDGYMDSADVCRVLNITKRTLQSYRDKGILPYTRIGGKFFYRERDLADCLERRTIKKQ